MGEEPLTNTADLLVSDTICLSTQPRKDPLINQSKKENTLALLV